MEYSNRHFFSVEDVDGISAFRTTIMRFFYRPFRDKDGQVVRAGVQDRFRRRNDLDRVKTGRSNYSCGYGFLINWGFRGTVCLGIGGLLFLFITAGLALC